MQEPPVVSPPLAAATETPVAIPDTPAERRTLAQWSLLIGTGVLATTLPQTQLALAKLPLQHLLKDILHVPRASMAAFFFWASIAWNVKPVAGIVTDSFPIFGTRRRHYLMLSAAAAALCWFITGFVPRHYAPLLAGVVLMNVFLVVVSTVTGGLMVQGGQENGATGRLSSVRYLVTNICILTAGIAGGFLATRPFEIATTLCAFIVASVIPVAFLYLERPVRGAQGGGPYRASAAPDGHVGVKRLARAWQELKSIAKARTLWAAAGLLFLVYIAPGFQTPLYYYQTDTLHFSQQFIGNLQVAGGACGLAGAALYALLCRRFSLRWMLLGCITLAAVATLGYLYYHTRTQALIIEGVAGFTGTLAELALMDLAARATPRGGEALGFALMMSVRNLSFQGSDAISSRLADTYHLPFSTLVWLNAGTTVLVLIAIPLLPKVLIDRRDGQAGA